MWPFASKPTPPRREPQQAPAPRKKPSVLFDDFILASAATPELTRSDYRLPSPPPGVVPEHVAVMAQDDAISGLYNWAGAQPGQNGFFAGWGQGVLFPGYQILAEMAQVPEYRRGSAVIAEEMTRKWIKLTARGDGKGDKIAKLEAALERYHVRDVFHQALLHDGLFGIGRIFIDVGVEGTDLSKPLVMNPAMIGRGKLRGIRTVEPMWCYPAQYNTTNPLAENWYKPETWFVMGTRVHETRLLSIVSREVPDLLKPAYMFGGLPRTMMARESVENFRRTRQSVSDLLYSFTTFVLKTELSSMLTAGSSATLFNRIAGFLLFRSNKGLLVVDKDTEELDNVSAPLSGLDALQAQSQEQIASVQAIPLVKLLGVQPSGLNASSDGEIRVFYDSTHAENEKTVRVPLTHVLNVIQLSEFGEVDPEIGFEFVPLWQMSEIETSTVQKTLADRDAVYIDAGVIGPDEVRNRLIATSDSGYSDLSGAPPDAPEEEDPSVESKSDDPDEGE